MEHEYLPTPVDHIPQIITRIHLVQDQTTLALRDQLSKLVDQGFGEAVIPWNEVFAYPELSVLVSVPISKESQ